MKSKKERRHSGRTTPHTTLTMKFKQIINSALEPQEFWDDWNDYRDGMRYSKDRTKIRSTSAWWSSREQVAKYNKKNKRLLQRRKRKKEKFKMGKY